MKTIKKAWITDAIASLAKLAYASGYITEKAYLQIMSALGRKAE